jgi:hypothetical protein
MWVWGKQNNGVQVYSSIIVEEDDIIKDYKGIEKLRIINMNIRINHQ